MTARPVTSPQRRWFAQGATVLLLILVAAVARGETFDLKPIPVGDATQHVSVTLEFGGELIAAERVASAAGVEAAEAQRAPLQVKATIEYDERALAGESSARLYRQAEASIAAAGDKRLPTLPPNRRLILAESNGDSARATLASPNGPLTREQLDLIDIASDARALDLVLPGVPVAEDGDWVVDEWAMAVLLGLDSIAVCEVRGAIDATNDDYLRFNLNGAVHGAVDSAAAEFDVRAVGLFHRGDRRVTHLNLAMIEKREEGPARPGVEGTAKINIKRETVDTPAELSDAALAAAAPGSDLALVGAPQGFRVEHDRNWHLAADLGDALTLRRVAESGLVAQTTLRRMPAKSESRRPTLESLEKDVRFSLGESFKQLVSSEQWVNQAGCYCLGLVAEGAIDGVPLEWRYYVVIPGDEEEGQARDKPRHTVAITTTVEKTMAEDAGQADRELADRMELIKPERRPAGIADAPAKKPSTKTTKRRSQARRTKQPAQRPGGIRR